MFKNKITNGMFKEYMNSSFRMDDEEAGEALTGLNVSEVGNEVFFYAPVMSESIVQLNRKLRSLETTITQFTAGVGIPAGSVPIKLRINSGGGSLFDGFAAVDAIKNCKVPVHTVIDGGAASAATLMSVVGKQRAMGKHSFMLIHQLSGGMWGKFEEMRDEIQNSELLMQSIQDIYLKHTKIPKKLIKDILKRDIWLDAKTCMEYGLVDEILGN